MSENFYHDPIKAGQAFAEAEKRLSKVADGQREPVQPDHGAILSDHAIKAALKSGLLKIEPLSPVQIQPASVDIRLSNSFVVVESSPSGIIRFNEPIKYKTFEAECYTLLPGQFVLASSCECFDVPNNLTAFVEGRSSLGRMGLFIQNAGWVDPGFKGQITLELFNANCCAIELRAGWRIGQMVFAQLDQPASKPYNGKYQNQEGATGSRVYMDIKEEKCDGENS